MPFKSLIVAVALLAIAASARAAFVSAIPEPATVTLIFVALATIGLVAVRKRGVEAVEAKPND